MVRIRQADSFSQSLSNTPRSVMRIAGSTGGTSSLSHSAQGSFSVPVRRHTKVAQPQELIASSIAPQVVGENFGLSEGLGSFRAPLLQMSPGFPNFDIEQRRNALRQRVLSVPAPPPLQARNDAPFIPSPSFPTMVSPPQQLLQVASPFPPPGEFLQRPQMASSYSPPPMIRHATRQALPAQRARSLSPFVEHRDQVIYQPPQNIGMEQLSLGRVRSRSASPALDQSVFFAPVAAQKPARVLSEDVRIPLREVTLPSQFRQENIVRVPEVSVVDAIKQVPPRVEVKQVTKQVGKVIPECFSHLVEVPVALKVEKIIEVPEVQGTEVIKTVPRPHLQQVEKRVPKTIFQGQERTVDQDPFYLMAEEIIEVPEITQAVLRVDVPQEERKFVEKFVETPINEYVEKIVEVPVTMEQECFAEVVEPFKVELRKQLPLKDFQRIDKEVPVEELEYVEKIVEVPHIVYQERLNEIPEIVYKEVVKEVPRYEVQYLDKIVEKEVVEYVETIIEVPHIIYQERPVEVPEIHKVTAKTQRPAVDIINVRREVPVPRLRCREQQVEVEVEPFIIEKMQLVEVPQVQDVVTQVGRVETVFINKPVPSVTFVPKDKIVEVPAVMERERLVEVPQIKAVERTRQVVNEVFQEVPVQIPYIEYQYVDKVVPIGVPQARTEHITEPLRSASARSPSAVQVSRGQARYFDATPPRRHLDATPPSAHHRDGTPPRRHRLMYREELVDPGGGRQSSPSMEPSQDDRNLEVVRRQESGRVKEELRYQAQRLKEQTQRLEERRLDMDRQWTEWRQMHGEVGRDIPTETVMIQAALPGESLESASRRGLLVAASPEAATRTIPNLRLDNIFLADNVQVNAGDRQWQDTEGAPNDEAAIPVSQQFLLSTSNLVSGSSENSNRRLI